MGTESNAGPDEKLQLLIAEADAYVRDACGVIAARLGFGVKLAGTAAEARKIAEADEEVQIILLDLRVPGGSFELLHALRESSPRAVIVILSAVATLHYAIEAMRMGAYDFVSIPFVVEELRIALVRAADHWRSSHQIRRARERMTVEREYMQLIGDSPVMERLYYRIAKIAASASTVLIRGERGSGKEVVARAIHAAGANAQRRFLVIDCVEIAARGAESRIFGDGSNPRGLLERSFGGSVLFDEVAALSPAGQAMLARVIDRRTPYRILASTVYDLEARVREGLFRRDLYIRLNVFPVTVPPLRERRSDIPMPSAHFLKRVAGSRDSSSKDLPFKLTDEVLRLLTHYDWPENVRELENCMISAANMTDAEFIAKSQLTTPLRNLVGNGKDDPAKRAYGEIVPLAEIEKRTILNALRACAGDRIETARRLRIGKTTLYRKLKEYEAMGVDLHSTGASA